VKVLLRSTEADLKTIKESSGFVGVKESRSKASGKVYHTVAFASTALADRALETAKIEGRNWSVQTKGLGHRA
jgi:acyl-CoA reductase-like NAD-dependent aldehyde dehydrogenase